MSAGNQRQQGRGGYLETYEFVDDRIAKFREDYPGAMGRIETIPLHSGDWCAFEARIWVRPTEHDPADGVERVNWRADLLLIANGHAFDKWGQPSQAEKTEKAAIGRALVMAGFAAKRGASQEEIDRHAEQERSGAPQQPGSIVPIDRKRNAPQASETRRSGDGNRQQRPQPQPAESDAEIVRYDDLTDADRARFRGSYWVIVKHARSMVEKDASEDAIKEFLRSKKKSMRDAEYADALYRFGEIQTMIADRDLVEEVAAEMGDDYEDAPGGKRDPNPADLDF